MNACRFVARSLADTDRLGRALAEDITRWDDDCPVRYARAGKTRLVQAVAAACEVPREFVVSPTFVLCQQYFGTRTIYHLDAYRLRDVEEFRQLGSEEILQSPGLVFIEWADRIPDGLPAEYVNVQIDIDNSDHRLFEIQNHGDRLAAVIARLNRRLASPD